MNWLSTDELCVKRLKYVGEGGTVSYKIIHSWKCSGIKGWQLSHNCVNILKATERYTLKGWILQYANYISIFKKDSSSMILFMEIL